MPVLKATAHSLCRILTPCSVESRRDFIHKLLCVSLLTSLGLPKSWMQGSCLYFIYLRTPEQKAVNSSWQTKNSQMPWATIWVQYTVDCTGHKMESWGILCNIRTFESTQSIRIPEESLRFFLRPVSSLRTSLAKCRRNFLAHAELKP